MAAAKGARKAWNVRGAVARTPRGSKAAATGSEARIMAKTAKSGRKSAKPARAGKAARKPKAAPEAEGRGSASQGRAKAKAAKPKAKPQAAKPKTPRLRQGEDQAQAESRAAKAKDRAESLRQARERKEPSRKPQRARATTKPTARPSRNRSSPGSKRRPLKVQTGRDWSETLFLPKTDFPDEGRPAGARAGAAQALGAARPLSSGCAPRRRAARNSSCMTGRLTPTATSISAPASTRS